ncbi:hypothetical protein AB0H88_40470 [Nonomuraea sp. NPDC050680]|uniref:hypothetical protein n=1 Tax=Nonomuraea sp. NPDC050680 TaxID=3154630 RepID=UPI0033C7B2FA
MLRLCLLRRSRKGVLGYASSGTGRGGPALYASRWKSLLRAVAEIWRPRIHPAPAADEWVLAREADGWALRSEGDIGPAVYFTTDIPADDQNAAFDWARRVTPDVAQKAIHYVGPPPL